MVDEDDQLVGGSSQILDFPSTWRVNCTPIVKFCKIWVLKFDTVDVMALFQTKRNTFRSESIHRVYIYQN